MKLVTQPDTTELPHGTDDGGWSLWLAIEIWHVAEELASTVISEWGSLPIPVKESFENEAKERKTDSFAYYQKIRSAMYIQGWWDPYYNFWSKISPATLLGQQIRYGVHEIFLEKLKALTRARLRWAFARTGRVFYVAGADNVASLHLHAALGFQELKRFESERSAAGVEVLSQLVGQAHPGVCRDLSRWHHLARARPSVAGSASSRSSCASCTPPAAWDLCLVSGLLMLSAKLWEIGLLPHEAHAAPRSCAAKTTQTQAIAPAASR
jgi:hypothetical protein